MIFISIQQLSAITCFVFRALFESFIAK